MDLARRAHERDDARRLWYGGATTVVVEGAPVVTTTTTTEYHDDIVSYSRPVAHRAYSKAVRRKYRPGKTIRRH